MSHQPSTSRYAVEQFPRLDFNRLINRPGDGALTRAITANNFVFLVVSAKYLQSYGKTGGFSIERPLGCAFDPARRQWIVTDDRVVRLPLTCFPPGTASPNDTRSFVRTRSESVLALL